VAPGANVAGCVRLEEGVFLGAGSCVIPGVTIGSWTIVGAGAAVVSDLPASVVAVGVPAVLSKVYRANP
jgi:acetyltransferase-like isoleucine patch superfamily enzyme